jgi:hypothetical protein
MFGRRRSLLSQIERGAADGRSDLADVLRQCITLGGHARSAELRDWARRELDGYRGAEVPSYRRLEAPLLLDGLQGHWQLRRKQISVYDLPDFAQEAMREGLTIPFGIAELERLARKSDPIDLQPAGADDLVYFMNHSAGYNVQVERLYYSASPTSIHGIVDQIRTNLVALAAELRASAVASDGVPTAAAADQAVKVVVKGFARVNVAVGENAIASATSNNPVTNGRDAARVPSWIRGPWVIAIGVTTILGGIAAAASVGWIPVG